VPESTAHPAPAPPSSAAISPPAVFYHVAAMNTWRSVVAEQLRLLAHVGLTTGVTVGLLGDAEDAATVTALAARFGVAIDIAFRRPDLSLAELPTLAMLHGWAKRQPPGRPVLYLHTKGVSRPTDRVRIAWRRAMQRYTVADWPDHVRLLTAEVDPVDLAGFCWTDSITHHPHFSGNVWMARCGWVAALDPPGAYRLSRPVDFQWGGEPWRQRMFCETWIGSRGGARVAALGCRNVQVWKGDAIYDFDTTVPGFRYEGGDGDGRV
jgi:hypothetical protein